MNAPEPLSENKNKNTPTKESFSGALASILRRLTDLTRKGLPQRSSERYPCIRYKTAIWMSTVLLFSIRIEAMGLKIATKQLSSGPAIRRC